MKIQDIITENQQFTKVNTSPAKAWQMLGGKHPVGFAVEVLCPSRSVVSTIKNKIGTPYVIDRDDSIEGNGIGIEIISPWFEGGRTAQDAYEKILDIIEQSGGQFNQSTQTTVYRQKQGMAEGHADQQRTIFKRNGQPVGEIGIDRESSPGAGMYYMKHYASGTDNSGYDSREEALGDLRHIMKQSVYGELREQGVSEGADDFSRNIEAFRVYQHLDPMEFYNFAKTPQGLKTLAQKAGTTPESVKDSLERMDWGQFPADFYQDPEDEEQGVTEGQAQPLTVAQLAMISDEALDRAYGYGRSTPGNTFGWQANLKSAAYAKKMIDSGVTDIEAISDAIHKGWNVTAQAFVQNPDQFADTEKLRAAGKLQAKLDQRAKLMRQNYAQLADEEKEKDRVVARALLQALRGKQA